MKPKVEVVCAACGKPYLVSYKYFHMKVFITRVCISCSLKNRWYNNKVEMSEAAKISTTKLWQNSEYRDKVLAALPKAVKKPNKVVVKCPICMKDREVGRRYIQNPKNANRPCRACSMKSKWNNDEYRDKITDIAGENTKKLWENEDYRKAITESNSKTWSGRTEELSRRALSLWQNTEYRLKVISQTANIQRTSSIQILLYKLLDDLGVDYLKEGLETTIGYFTFDCLIKNKLCRDILIECQGDYWHTLPNNVNRDKSKFTYIDRYFPQYEIVYIWEHEFYEKDGVLDRLKAKLNIELETVGFEFNDVKLKHVERTNLRSFLDAYHYIGNGRGGTAIGAYLNDLLIGCVVFSPLLRQNIRQQFIGVDKLIELSRFCIHPRYHKKNFASWLISQSMKFASISSVIAYADTTIGHTGVIYKASNFKLHHRVSADYWYVDRDGFVMHKKTLYERARKQGLKEVEYASQFGYNKKFGGEKLCYVYQR